MRHPKDGNLVAMDRHLTELEAGELRAEEWEDVLHDVIENHWDEVIAELGDDTIRDFFYGVYMDTMSPKDMEGFQRIIDAAIETVAQRISK